MKGYSANTDFDWYVFLAQQPNLDEVNFWQPSGGREFRAIPRFAPFFFKLSRFGYYARFSILPPSLPLQARPDPELLRWHNDRIYRG